MSEPSEPVGRVLILEDDPGIAALERRRLERAGFEVAIAAESTAARGALEPGGFDLMVLDQRLNDHESGLDFYLGLRADGRAIPSILVTGFADEATLTQAIRAGIRDFLPKTPDYLDYLAPTVARVLAQVRTEQALERERAARVEAEAARAGLAEADRRKDQFLAMLAHELRNPLAALSGAVEVVRHPSGASEQAWAAEVAARQVTNLTRLLDDLLDVVRFNVGKIELRRELVDLATIIDYAVAVVRPQMESRRHDFAATVRDRPLPIDGDATRLEQILTNLLTNAAKYTEEGGRVRLDAERDGDAVVVRVADNGFGIAPELRQRVFEPFAQVQDSGRWVPGGMGLGLALVKQLVEMHGGSVSLGTPPDGPGSVFTVRLPAATAAAASRPGPVAAPVAMRPLRVLIVDDSHDAAELLARLVARSGHEVRTAADGASGLEVATTFRPALVLLDLALPGGMDGFELARRLRAMPDLKRAKLVAVSGYGQESDRVRTREAGCDDLLVKPIALDRLHAILAETGGSSPDPTEGGPPSAPDASEVPGPRLAGPPGGETRHAPLRIQPL